MVVIRPSSLISRLSALSVALLALVVPVVEAPAQTAPQLLPYVSKLIAGGGAGLATGSTLCPVSGNTATDIVGDGCLATEVTLTSPKYAIADRAGNIFIADYTAGRIRRVDVVTGIITTVAGGATTSPAAGTTGATCGGTSVDVKGDGCLANLVFLQNPSGMAFAANGDLYITEAGSADSDVRKIAATNGLITTTGIIALVAGNPAKSTGYAVNQGATLIIPGSAQSYLDFPTDVYFDTAGNLYIADEGNEALEVVNLNLTPQTVQGVTIPPGTIAKIAGYGAYQTKSTTVECPNGVFTSSTNRGGCYFGAYSNTAATPSVTALLDAPYALALDPAGKVYFANEFIEGVGKISGGSLTNYAGINGTYAAYNGTTTKYPRAKAGTFAIGSDFGIDVDSNSNAYITDALNGVIWRVDGAGQSMYVVAGGATTVPVAGSACPGNTAFTATDKYGDGCPATSATFGKSGTSFASTGVYGVSVDVNSDLFVGDSVNNVIREVASGTQFGNIGATKTDYLDVHFAAGDGPLSAGGFAITSGQTIFTIGTTTYTVNSDNSTDYIVPVTASPTVSGAFNGTLTVYSNQVPAGTSFSLSGNFVQSPVTVVKVTTSSTTGCSGTIYPTTSGAILTATLVANGPSAPTGTITFFANGTQIGTPQTVTNLGSAASPSYGATLTNTFSTAGNYAITAVYAPTSGSYFLGSTSSAVSITSTAPALALAATQYQEASVTAGGTALFSFTLTQTVYTGTISFSCSGLPAYSTCSFSPQTITAAGCTATNTIALSIQTQQATPVKQASMISSGRWAALSTLSGFSMFLVLLGIRRRGSAMRLRRAGMMLSLLLAASSLLACGKGVQGTAATPSSGATPYTVTVTATGSTGTVASIPVLLTVK